MSKVYTSALLFAIFSSTAGLAQAAVNPCEVPFKEMIDPRTGVNFKVDDALNTSGKVGETFNYRGRFLVADLDTKDASGQCKGVEERYPFIDASAPDLAAFPDLQDAETLRHFVQNVQGQRDGRGFYEEPASADPIETVNGQRFCTGQTVSFCEVRGSEVVEIARLATSGQNANGQPSLYVPLNQTTLRSWALQRDYTQADANHDRATGGISESQSSGLRYSKYVSGGGWVMPNFVKWDAVPGFETRGYMGLHQLTRGESNVVVPGSPVSHGCFRLSRYGSVLNRWWTPFGAKMFIRFTPGRYRKTP